MMRRYFLFYTSWFCWCAWIWMCCHPYCFFILSLNLFTAHSMDWKTSPLHMDTYMHVNCIQYMQIDRDVFVAPLHSAHNAKHFYTDICVHERVCVHIRERELNQRIGEREKCGWTNVCATCVLLFFFHLENIGNGRIDKRTIPTYRQTHKHTLTTIVKIVYRIV